MTIPYQVSAANDHASPVLRLVAVAAVLLELIALREISVGRYLLLSKMLDAGHPGGSFLWYVHTASKLTLFGLIAALIASAVERRFAGASMSRQYITWAAANVIGFAVLCGLILMLPLGRDIGQFTSRVSILYFLSAAAFLWWQLTVLMLVSPKSLFRQMTRPSIGFCIAAMAAAVALSWNENALLDFITDTVDATTFKWSLAIYETFGNVTPSIDLSGPKPLVTVGGFTVLLSAACSGYQGMIAVSLIIGGLVVLEAPSLRLGRALVVASLSIVLVFLLNSVRIAVLLHVGEAYSARLAAEGLHSYLGTVLLLCVAALAMIALQHPFVRYDKPQPQWAGINHATSATSLDLSEALTVGLRLTVPLAAYLGCSILLGMLNTGFNWLYPVLATTGIVLLILNIKVIAEHCAQLSILSGFGVGFAVYVFWVFMIPVDEAANTEFKTALASVPTALALVWMVFRLIGGSLVVPVLEELAFRAGIPGILGALLRPQVGAGAASIIAFAGSSLAFGLMHSNIIAGALAGACYGLLTLRTGKVGDAIVAHAVTNFLIAVTAVTTARWYLW